MPEWMIERTTMCDSRVEAARQPKLISVESIQALSQEVEIKVRSWHEGRNLFCLS
jgi:hypothetical protein